MAAAILECIGASCGAAQGHQQSFHLQLKNTFVDVIDTGAHAALPVRRVSDPGPLACRQRIFRLPREEEEYVEELQEHVRVGSIVRCSSKATAGSCPTKDTSHSHTKDADAGHALSRAEVSRAQARAPTRASFSAWSEATTASELPEEPLSPLSPLSPAKSTSSKLSWADMEDEEIPEPPEPFSTRATLERRATTSSWAASEGKAASASLARVPCTGSVGHPFLCNHPCKNLAAQGHCPDGAACGFCHLPHERRRLTHLDKKNRSTLRDMSARGKVELLWPILQAKVEALAMGPCARHALLNWLREVDAAIPRHTGAEDAATKDSDGRRLLKCLKTMSVVEICMTPGPGEGGSCIREASECLLSELRAASLVVD